jgi:hypothetical protein
MATVHICANTLLKRCRTELISDKQLGFSDEKQTTAKERAKLANVPSRAKAKGRGFWSS